MHKTLADPKGIMSTQVSSSSGSALAEVLSSASNDQSSPMTKMRRYGLCKDGLRRGGVGHMGHGGNRQQAPHEEAEAHNSCDMACGALTVTSPGWR